MVFKFLSNLPAALSIGLPLRVILVVPFVLQIFGTVGLVSYLSFRNGQRVVNDLALQLRQELTARIEGELRVYTEAPHIINQLNANALARGDIDITNIKGDYFFWEQSQIFPGTSWIYCGSEREGDFLGVGREPGKPQFMTFVNAATDRRFVNYTLDEQGKRTQTLPQDDSPRFDSRTRPWYRNAVAAGQPSWGEIYLDALIHLPLLSANIPVYDNGGKLIGVCATEFFLSEEFAQFLKNLDIGKSGETFIMERSGTLLVTSLNELPYVKNGDNVERIEAIALKHPLVRETAKYLQAHFGDFDRIQTSEQLDFILEGKRQFVQVQPFRDEYGLDWLIVVTIPEADFMEQIHANTRTTLALCLAALVVAIAIGIVTARWVTQPILHLNESAKKLTKGEWHKIVEMKREDELGELAKSFNSMAVQLQDWFDKLEQRVQERTAELAESNRQLEIAKEKADAANKAKSTFLANMSHELRTPLNAILGFSQILTRSQRLDLDQQENVNLINRSGEYLLTLINNILNLSKIEAGKTTLNPSDFDLYQLLNDLESMFSLKAETKQLYLSFQRGNDTPRFIHTDELKLRQVLINLINNAIKFTREGGISIRVQSMNNEGTTNNQQPITIQFEIEDTGVGIAPEESDRVFEAFGQSKSGLTTQEGTGLGLPISRKFVQLMGGDITVESQVDRGSTFTFSIQATLAKSNAIASPETKRQAIALASDQPIYRLLIVDDKPVNRQLLIKLFNPFGFELKEAQNGQEAIEIWQNWQPHLIWMDLRMPVMNGYEATQKIRSYPKGQGTAIIAITASVLEEEQAVVLSSGFDDFIRKPFRSETILTTLEKHLGVVFIYEESNEPAPRSSSQKLTPAALDCLSEKWLKTFNKATIEGDVKQIQDLILAIQPQHREIATALKELADRYELEQLLELTERGGNS
ncbi:MAG: ATP-binding protein [Spirulina sp.]